MNKRAAKAGITCGIFLGAVIVAYAITSLFVTKSEKSNFIKKPIIQFVINTGLNSGEVGRRLKVMEGWLCMRMEVKA